MDQPDLHEMAATVRALRGGLDDLNEAIDDAYSAALGEWEADDDDAPIEGTASGDDPSHFESARKHVNEARGSMLAVEEVLATAQGYRDFNGADVPS
jgi:hypothetical protein